MEPQPPEANSHRARAIVPLAGPCRFQARAVVRRCTAPSARTAARTECSDNA
ncbi:hypothetical protein JG687_00015039, partial [Phytophthora cactorum]